jgi:hypothetical protein
MLMFRTSSLWWLFIVLTSVMFIIGSCSSLIPGNSKDGSKWSGKTRQLESAGKAYIGPQYTIGIVKFDSKPSVKLSGVGEVAETILQTQFETAGLKTILLDMNELREAQKSKVIQLSNVVKVGSKDAYSGVDALDFRLSGTITAYSEVEERVDTIIPQKKIDIARVTVEYALFDIATGKPLLAESGTGEYRNTSTGALGLEASSSLDPNLLDGALRDAITKATEKIIHKLGSLPFQGKLLAAEGTSLVLKAGRRSQLKEGTQLAVYRVSEALADPDSGQILGYRESKIGVIKIASHQNENLSSATIVSGSGFQPGDVAKPIP